MGSKISVLACDIGGGSGRILAVNFNGNTMDYKLATRFDNHSVSVGDSLYWDVLGIYKGIKDGLVKCANLGIRATSMGIDTWGNDFCFIDKQGYMLENPYSYRDARTDGIQDHVNQIIPNYQLYSRNGVQQVKMNTLYQLVSLVKNRQYMFDIAHKFLFIPDLLTYFLTGEIFNEYTLASISQLFNYSSNSWDFALTRRLGIPSDLFSNITLPCEKKIPLKDEICNELHIDSIPLITVGAHDTASAVVAVPQSQQTIYISSGTWSIVGTEVEKPIINEQAYKYNFSNEGGVGGTIRLLKNVMGMWIVQELQRVFSIDGRVYSFSELIELVKCSKPFGAVIDPDDVSFYQPLNMAQAIRQYCSRTGQRVPETDGELIRTAFESLALKYRYVVEKLEMLVCKELDSIYIIGGGCQNELVNQMTSNCCKKPVYAGPVEATALGNAVTQLIALGELNSISEARAVIKESFQPKMYVPQDTEQWEQHYQYFLSINNLL